MSDLRLSITLYTKIFNIGHLISDINFLIQRWLQKNSNNLETKIFER